MLHFSVINRYNCPSAEKTQPNKYLLFISERFGSGLGMHLSYSRSGRMRSIHTNCIALSSISYIKTWNILIYGIIRKLAGFAFVYLNGFDFTFSLTVDVRCLFFTSIHGSESKSGKLVDNPLDTVWKLLVSVFSFGLTRLPILGELGADSSSGKQEFSSRGGLFWFCC